MLSDPLTSAARERHLTAATGLPQVLTALRLWERLPANDQIKAICRGIAHNVPVEPTQEQRLRWSPVADDLAALMGTYQKLGVVSSTTLPNRFGG